MEEKIDGSTDAMPCDQWIKYTMIRQIYLLCKKSKEDSSVDELCKLSVTMAKLMEAYKSENHTHWKD